jgi:hypothetical protein
VGPSAVLRDRRRDRDRLRHRRPRARPWAPTVAVGVRIVISAEHI